MKKWIVVALCISCAASAAAGDRGDRIAQLEESAREFALGLSNQRRGEFDAAEAHYRRALELDADYVEAMVNLARLHVDGGDATEALDLLARAGAMRPDYAKTYTVGGLAALRGRNFATAVEQLGLALELDSYDLEALINLGVAWIGAGRPERAKEPLEKALRLDPASSEASLNLAIAEELCDRPSHAAFWYARFLELAGQEAPNADAVRERSLALANNGPREEVPPDPGLGAKRQTSK